MHNTFDMIPAGLESGAEKTFLDEQPVLFRSLDDLKNRLSLTYHYILEEGIKSPDNFSNQALLTLIISTQTAYQAPIAALISEKLAALFKLPQSIQSSIHSALHEAIANAAVHGNLDLSSPANFISDYDYFYKNIHNRLNDNFYANRAVIIEVFHHDNQLLIGVEDEGSGFDLLGKLNDKEVNNTIKGIHIIQSLCTTLEFQKLGKRIEFSFDIPSKTDGKGDSINSLMNASIFASRILVVDDTDFSRILLGEMLAKYGFINVHFAHDGKVALEKTQHLNPDLVLLDLMMPIVDGFEYCRRIRKNPRFIDMPILAQTGITTPEHRNKVFNCGATDLILKPVNADELSARCIIHLEKSLLLKELQAYKSRVAHELKHARSMQNLLLPSEKTLHSIEHNYSINIASYFETSSEMGGDFWGTVPLSENALAIYMCDFSGHGVTAALNTFRLHTLMQDMMMRSGSQPGEFLSTLNHAIYPLISRDQFCTVFYGVINTQYNTLCYSTAACPSPLLWNNKNQCLEVINGSGIPLGVIDSTVYSEVTIPFHKNDVLTLYSDALIETKSRTKDFISEESLCGVIASTLSSSPITPSKSVIAALMSCFSNHSDEHINDDLTIAVFSR